MLVTIPKLVQYLITSHDSPSLFFTKIICYLEVTIDNVKLKIVAAKEERNREREDKERER